MPPERALPLAALTLSAVLAAPPAHAGPLVEGTRIRAHYGDEGVWNDRTATAGFQTRHDDAWVEWTYPGNPFAMWRMAWDDGGSSPEDYSANSNTQSTNATLLEFQDLSSDTHRVARHR